MLSYEALGSRGQRMGKLIGKDILRIRLLPLTKIPGMRNLCINLLHFGTRIIGFYGTMELTIIRTISILCWNKSA